MNRHLSTYCDTTLKVIFVWTLLLFTNKAYCQSASISLYEIEDRSTPSVDWIVSSSELIGSEGRTSSFTFSSISNESNDSYYASPYFYYYQIENLSALSTGNSFHFDLSPDSVVHVGYIFNGDLDSVFEPDPVYSLSEEEPLDYSTNYSLDWITFDNSFLTQNYIPVLSSSETFYFELMDIPDPIDPLYLPDYQGCGCEITSTWTFMTGAETPSPALPEPSIYGLMLVGIAVLRAVRQKRAL